MGKHDNKKNRGVTVFFTSSHTINTFYKLLLLIYDFTTKLKLFKDSAYTERLMAFYLYQVSKYLTVNEQKNIKIPGEKNLRTPRNQILIT